MGKMQAFAWLLIGLVPSMVQSLASTDEISDADPAQSGYLPNHNMQPAIVDSSAFGILWTNTYLTKEAWYAKPLVYTPPGKKQLVFTASNQNWIRTVDAVTGTLIASRQVQPPFLQSDLRCGDMPNYIGIAGTPVIDPSTNTAYFFAKGYQGNANSGGVAKGTYKFYAVDIVDLTDRPGFPVLIDGHNADNDKERYFLGGTVLQRPSLTLINGVVYGAFGGHCDLFNYTGMIAGVSTTASVGVTSLFAMESSPYAPPVVSDIFQEDGGKAGIWQSGMAPATDGSRLFVVTGNGQGHENKDTPASGRAPLSTLDEVIANLAVSGSGKLSLQDYFEPYEYIGMDAGDRDLGSSGVTLLDSSVFKGTNGISRLAVTVGKNGKAYICNADNLGGFKLGPGGTDNVIQTIISPNAVFGGVGSYPLEGGYIYFTPVGNPTLVYKLGLDQNGSPLFSKVGQSLDNSAGRVGVGVPTITSYQGQSGTGLVWLTDVEGGLKVYKAVPGPDGKLVKINIPPTGGLNKFQRPAFGDGRLYVTNNNGQLISMGSPVALPLNCTSPVNFGDLSYGNTAMRTVTCTALIAITKIQGATTGSAFFQVQNSSFPTGPLTAGQKFSFPVLWNLTRASSQDASGTSFGQVTPGVKTSPLVIYTVNGVAKYSTSLPITLQGNEVSQQAFLSLSPAEVDFGGIVIGSPGAGTGLDSSIILSNVGSMPLKLTGFGYTSSDNNDGALFKNVTTTDGKSTIGAQFTSSDFPAVGTFIAAGGSLTIPVNFNSKVIGNYHNLLQFWTNGGDKNVLFTGSATKAPIAELALETSEHGWDTASGIMDFGTVLAGTTQTRRLRICNKGGSALLITKSKPPLQRELRAENPTSDLHEGQSIPVGECAYAPIDIAAAPETPNVPSHSVSDYWVLNTDDLTFGVHEVQIKAIIISRQVGPSNPDGSPKYRYLGCYADGQGRQLAKNYNLGTQNENGACQRQCLSQGYRFAGTEYHVECWCGNNPPSGLKYTPESAKKCTFGCAADSSQACGGDGTYASIYYDASKYTPDCDVVQCSSSSSTTSQSSTVSTSSTVSIRSLSQTSSLSLSGTSTGTSTVSSTSSLSSSQSSTSQTPTTLTSTSQSSTSQTSINSATSSSPSSSASSTTGMSSLASSSTSSSPPGPTGPVVNPGNSAYRFLSCYQDGATGKAIANSVKYANDSMTVAVCLDYCKTKGTIYAGIEYRRECYCGDSLATDAVSNAVGCSLTCKSNATEFCGGSLKMDVYRSVTLSTSTSSSPSTTGSTTASAGSSLSSSVSSTGSTSSSSTATGSISSLATTSTSLTTSSSPTTTSSVSATPTLGFKYLGCYHEPPRVHAMKLVGANNSMSVEMCISSAKARLTAKPATTYSYVGVEYGRECWGATSAVTSQTSMVGGAACTMKCAGASSQSCGGRAMYNYYATTAVTASTLPSSTSTTGKIVATSL